MSLKPRKVNFNEMWVGFQETVKGVITLAHVPRATWNDRFRWAEFLWVKCNGIKVPVFGSVFNFFFFFQ